MQGYLRWSTLSPAVETPSLSLVDFARVSIPSGGSATVTLSMSPRDMAVLTAPRCGVVDSSPHTSLKGSPYRTLAPFSGGADACCSRCAAEEECEAFTARQGATAATATSSSLSSSSCELYTHWGLTNSSDPTATSGEPLSQWVLRPGTIEVLVGGSSDALAAVGTLTVTGTETALTACPRPLPNVR